MCEVAVMADYENNAFFWQKVDTLFLSGKLAFTKKKGKHMILSAILFILQTMDIWGIRKVQLRKVSPSMPAAVTAARSQRL